MADLGKYIFASHKGAHRKRNQDSSFVEEQNGLKVFIIFDGVSSLNQSYKFIESFKSSFKYFLFRKKPKIASISKSLYTINKELSLRYLSKGLSTMSCLIIDENQRKVFYLNIGDSRIYLFNNQFIEKMTEDDSLGEFNPVITKCLGDKNLTIQDFELKELDFDDTSELNFLLCSDGFYHLMNQDLRSFFRIINFRSLHRMKNGLNYLIKNNNLDDSTYIIIRNVFQ